MTYLKGAKKAGKARRIRQRSRESFCMLVEEVGQRDIDLQDQFALIGVECPIACRLAAISHTFLSPLPACFSCKFPPWLPCTLKLRRSESESFSA